MKPPCSIEGCDRISWARGWCARHYDRWRRNGDPVTPKLRAKRPPKPCVIEGCERPHLARGWCQIHYIRWYTHGDPLLTKHHNVGKTCSTPECERPAKAVGMCRPCYDAEWARRNPDRAAAAKRAWNERNPGGNNAASRAWRARNPDRIREFRRARRMREFAAEGSHTEQEWRELLAAWRGLCAYYLAARAGERDHVVPISRGGSDDITNIVPACLPCNRTKSDRTLDEWLAALFGEEVAA